MTEAEILAERAALRFIGSWVAELLKGLGNACQSGPAWASERVPKDHGQPARPPTTFSDVPSVLRDMS